MVELLRRDPSNAYYSNALFLPRSTVPEMQIKAALTYDLGKESYRAYTIERDHFVVPRNYYHPELFRQLRYPVIDARIRRFPRASFRSKITLDFQDPKKTIQRDAVSALLNANDGLLTLRCGMGKTVCAIHALSKVGVPGLVLVTDKGLAQQWMDEILEWTDLQEDDVGFIGDGVFKWKKKLTIGLVQTVARHVNKGTLPRELVEHFGVVVPDEAHTTSGPAYFGQAISPFHGRRWGLTATPRRSDHFDSLLRYTMGKVLYQHLEPELTPLIYFRQMPTKLNMNDKRVREACCDVSGELHLQRIYGYLATDQARVAAIVEEIETGLKQGRQLLVLSQSVAMLERLGQVFPQAGIVHGGVKDRKERLRRIKECNPVIATSSLGRQALNKPRLDTLMVLEPFRDPGVLQQLLGRIQRKYDGKQQPIAVFYDDVHIADMHKICMKMRSQFSRWPEHMGGRLRWQVVGSP